MQKYKVFFNEKSIVFSSTSKITLSKPWPELLKSPSIRRVKAWLKAFEATDEQETVLEQDRLEQMFQIFKSALLNLDAAGGVVIRNKKLLFIFRNGKWDLPKGKIEEGEGIKEAAIREIEEECGVSNLTIVNQLKDTYHVYEHKGEIVLKQTYWFELTTNFNGELIPQTEEGITKVAWLTSAEIENEVLKNTYASIKDLWSS